VVALVQRPRLAERRLRQRDLDAAEQELKQATDQLHRIVPAIEPEQFPGLEQHLDELEALARRRSDLERALLSDEELQELAGRVEKHSAELEVATKEQQALQQALSEADLLEAPKLEDAREKRSVLARGLETGSRRLQTLREEAAGLQGAMGRPVGVLEEEAEELEEREGELTSRFRGLSLAEEVWPEAVRLFQETYLDRYGERVGAWLEQLSGGRYGGVRLQGEDAAPEARRLVDGRWVPVDRLSRGASDRLYLALRLALTEVMGEQGVRGPLILDDPFVTFDAERLADAFETLRRVAERRQVILLAHDEQYRELGWPVLELRGPGGPERS